jgi:hypothetical protein
MNHAERYLFQYVPDVDVSIELLLGGATLTGWKGRKPQKVEVLYQPIAVDEIEVFRLRKELKSLKADIRVRLAVLDKQSVAITVVYLNDIAGSDSHRGRKATDETSVANVSILIRAIKRIVV